jgi:type I restriction enzyme M protein
VGDLVKQWKALGKLQTKFETYQAEVKGQFRAHKNVDAINRAQLKLQKAFEPFFESLHAGLKALDKIVRGHEKALVEKAKREAKAAGKETKRIGTDRNIKQLKLALEQLHKEVKSAESYFKHIHWLQERFPKAEYEDVTGLCKLATPEEVKEQDYSLNPGRYVGVVIEEDGKTEEEFLELMANLNDELISLNSSALSITKVIKKNISVILGE